MIVSGGSRGIGLAIALRAASEGAGVALLAKSAEPHPKLPGTIFQAAEELEAAGGKALPIVCDLRDDSMVDAAVRQTVDTFGGIDICLNNASAIDLSGTEEIAMKRFDLMHQVNCRGTFVLSKLCIPHLLRAENPHILTLSPPLNLNPRWAGANLAYTIAKYGMSLCTLGLAEELRGHGIAANSLWPRTLIATAAVRNLPNGESAMSRSRRPEIIADAAALILARPSTEATGNFYIDDEVIAEQGVTDLADYAYDTESELELDLYLDGWK